MCWPGCHSPLSFTCFLTGPSGAAQRPPTPFSYSIVSVESRTTFASLLSPITHLAPGSHTEVGVKGFVYMSVSATKVGPLSREGPILISP